MTGASSNTLLHQHHHLFISLLRLPGIDPNHITIHDQPSSIQSCAIILVMGHCGCG
jgi:hypothetical protein